MTECIISFDTHIEANSFLEHVELLILQNDESMCPFLNTHGCNVGTIHYMLPTQTTHSTPGNRSDKRWCMRQMIISLLVGMARSSFYFFGGDCSKCLIIGVVRKPSALKDWSVPGWAGVPLFEVQLVPLCWPTVQTLMRRVLMGRFLLAPFLYENM